jgi:hypothetical protein
MQSFHFPWTLPGSRWVENCDRICAPLQSITEMDSRIASMYPGKIKIRQISESFKNYYSDSAWIKPITVDEFIKSIVPIMQTLVRDAPLIFNHEVKGLVAGVTTNIVLTRIQIACLMSLTWFGLLNYPYYGDQTDNFPEPTFINIFITNNYFALSCLLNYFSRIHKYLKADRDIRETFEDSIIIIKRSASNPVAWETVDKKLCNVVIESGRVDESSAVLQAVFSQDLIGDKFCSGTLTQEELSILIRPELFVTLILCEAVEAHETITVIGAEKMSHISGFGSTMRFISDYIDNTNTSTNNNTSTNDIIKRCANVFLDSTTASPVQQFTTHFERDLLKAYTGFNSMNYVTAAGGMWTCGIAGSNQQLKFIQQLVAASTAGINTLHYYPGGHDFETALVPFVDWLRRTSLTVAELYTLYAKVIESASRTTKWIEFDLFTAIMHTKSPPYSRRRRNESR